MLFTITKNRLICLAVFATLTVALFLLFFFGRSIWRPVYTKIIGKRSTADVYRSIGEGSEKKLKVYFKKAGVAYPPKQIAIIALKEERKLEVWAKYEGENKFIHAYDFTGFSGKLGPKLKSGDRQIPEGLYGVEYLNPNSSYHLSIKVDYPNKFDIQEAKKEGRTNLGGDIFVHGKSVTIGCIPIGDSYIEELFTLVYRTGFKNVKVIIAPNDLRRGKSKYENAEIKWLDEKYRRIENSLRGFQRR